jgi:hypothetical protein
MRRRKLTWKERRKCEKLGHDDAGGPHVTGWTVAAGAVNKPRSMTWGGVRAPAAAQQKLGRPVPGSELWAAVAAWWYYCATKGSCLPPRGDVRAHAAPDRARLAEIPQLCDAGIEHDLHE